MISIITLTLISLAIFILGILVFIKGKRNITNISFVFLSLNMISWIIANYLADAPSQVANALFWNRATFAAGCLMGVFLLLFALVFPKSPKRLLAFWKLAIFIGLVITILTLFTDLIVEKIEFYDWGTNIVGGSLYIPVIIWAVAIIITTIAILVWKYKKSQGLEKLQLRYLFLGFFLFLLFTMTLNLILPVITGTNEYAKYGSYSVIFLIGFTTYAITRYRLMDIRLIIKRSLVTFLSFIVIVFFVWGIMAVVGSLIGRKPDPRLTIVGLVSVVLAILVFSLVKSFFEHLANKYFFTSLYNYQTAFEKLARELTHTINLDQIIDSIIESIKDTMRLDRAGVLLLNEQTSNYQVQKTIGFAADNGISLVRNNFLTNHLLKTRQPVIFQELESWPENSDSERSEIGKLKFNMKHIEAALCLPLIIRNKLIGIIVLGNKISKDAYTKEDLRLLDSISHQASIAVENARLYNNMEEIVDSQTKDIKAKARHLEKLLKMRSEFLDTTSHQLRTPTSVLIGILEMAVKGELDMLPQEKKQKQLEGAYLKAKKLEQIVSDLLRASELDSASFRLKLEDFREINLEEFLNRIITFKALEAEKQGVEVCLAKPLPCSKIFGEKIFLDEAMGNLIDNAIKYTPSKNKKTDTKGKIIISCAKDDKNIHIKIQDNGIGIPKEEIGKLFEKFNRASNAKEMYTDGTGLGLFIVKKIIEGHGGKIEVESGLGQGSTFIASLPLQPSLKNI